MELIGGVSLKLRESSNMGRSGIADSLVAQEMSQVFVSYFKLFRSQLRILKGHR